MKVHTSPTAGVARCRAEYKCPYENSHEQEHRLRGRCLFESNEAYEADRRRKQKAVRDAWRRRQRELDATSDLGPEDKAAASDLSEAVDDASLDALYDAFYARKHEARAKQLQEEWRQAARRGGRADLADVERVGRVVRRAWGLRSPAVRRGHVPWAPKLWGRGGRLAFRFVWWFLSLYPRAVDRAVGKPSSWVA